MFIKMYHFLQNKKLFDDMEEVTRPHILDTIVVGMLLRDHEDLKKGTDVLAVKYKENGTEKTVLKVAKMQKEIYSDPILEVSHLLCALRGFWWL